MLFAMRTLTKFLHFDVTCHNLCFMTGPLALIYYEKLIPGQQLVNRLHDLGYRVHVVTDLKLLIEQVEQKKPMVLVTELPAGKTVQDSISAVKENTSTSHVAVLAYAENMNPTLQETARAAGVNLVAREEGLLEQLPQLLEQVLQVD